MTSTTHTSQPADASGTFLLGGDLPVARLGFGAMRLPFGTFTGPAGTFRQRTELTTAQKKILTALELPEPRRVFDATPATR